MSRYLLWPEDLVEFYSKKNQKNARALDDLVAIGVSLEGADGVVLSVVNKSQLNGIKLEEPYRIVATKSYDKTSEWQNTIKKTGDPDNDNSLSVIEFQPPKAKLLQFFSLEPISLILPEKVVNVRENKNWNMNFEYLTNHPRYKSKDWRLRKSLRVCNYYYEYLDDFKKKYPTLNNTKSSYFPKSPLNILKKNPHLIKLRSLIGDLFIYPIILICFFSNWLSKVLQMKKFNLVKMSMLAQQVDLRCQQFCYFPVQHTRFTRNKHNRAENLLAISSSTTLEASLPNQYYPDYIRFYNTLWLILNDISFGMIFGSIIQDNNLLLSTLLNNFIELYCYQALKDLTIILSQNPLGIKLNEELAKFLSELFLWIIDFSYSKFLLQISSVEFFQSMLKVVTIISSMFGATFALSIIVDVLSLLTLPIYIFYRISSKLYHWIFRVMTSSIYLFFGMKINVLRKRKDNHEFQLDQLLMGTFIFTTLLFLTPTVLAFYISYTILQMGTMIIEISVESIVALINHFPLFALLLRFKDSKRIPGGITIHTDISPITHKIRYKLRNKPLNVIDMFKPYFLLIDNVITEYFSATALKKAAQGKPIFVRRHELYQILYSALPNEPVNVLKVYKDLKRL